MKVALNPYVLAGVVLVAIPGSRKVLREAVKGVILIGFVISDELQAIAEEVKNGDSTSPAKAKQSQIEPPAHECKSPACRCQISSQKDYCNQFCGDVEVPEDAIGCGCGHAGCDITQQLGNESAFHRNTAA